MKNPMQRRHTMAGLGAGGYQQFQEALLTVNSVAELRTLRPLPVDAQRVIDQTVYGVGLERLVIAADLMAAGLVYDLPDPLSVMRLDWELTGRTGHAQRVMTPDARGERQMPESGLGSIPIPITMDDFSLGIRTLRASQRVGTPLDTMMVAEATRNVNEAIEDSVINGIGITVAGNTAPGLLTDPVNTQGFVDSESWTAAGHSGEDILRDVLNMIETLHGTQFYGPYRLYVPPAYGLKLAEDYKSATSGTIFERLTNNAFQAGGQALQIRVADMLPADTVVLMQFTSNVAQMVVGQTPITVSWDGPGGFRYNAVVMAIMVPRLFTDVQGRQGWVVGTPAG